MQKEETANLVWFRSNLRVEDNTSLSRAIKDSLRVIGYINIDPAIFELSDYGFKKIEKFRTKFLLESIQDLKKQLNDINISLIITNQDFETSINSIIEKYNVRSIYMQKEWTRDELAEEKQIPKHINLIKDFDQFLYSPESVKEVYENIPRGFSNFRKKCEKYLNIEYPLQIPKPLDKKNNIDDVYSIPTLNDLGFEEFRVHRNSVFKFLGGETSAKERVYQYFFETKRISKYKLTRNGLLGKDYSSKLSSWLANGSLSVRFVYMQIKK